MKNSITFINNSTASILSIDPVTADFIRPSRVGWFTSIRQAAELQVVDADAVERMTGTLIVNELLADEVAAPCGEDIEPAELEEHESEDFGDEDNYALWLRTEALDGAAENAAAFDLV